MTKIKFCGLTRLCDIDAANELKPDYIGFVFAPKSRRYVCREQAAKLRKWLSRDIQAVGVFVNEQPETIAALLADGIIDAAQLHGGEDEAYIRRLREMIDKPIIKAFCINTAADVMAIQLSSADSVLIDSGSGGTGSPFDWRQLQPVRRPYFLAGGLDAGLARQAIGTLHPYALDVSSGIETDGLKDREKMAAFIAAVREETQT